MTRLSSLLWLAFAVAARAEVAVQVIGPPVCSGSGAIVAVSADDASVTVRMPVRSGEDAQAMALPAATAWTIRADVPGCWSERRVVSSQDRNLALHVFRAATVKSAFAAGPQRPSRLAATVLRGDTMDAADCRLSDPDWSCTVPAGVPFALRVEPEGFAALYYWDLRLEPDAARTLEPRVLKPGASVAGWLQDAKGRPLRGGRLTVQPLHGPPDATHVWPAAASDERGFFQIAGLEGGEYLLVATADPLSPASAVVRLRQGQSLLWPQPIRVLPRAKLDVILDPPLHGGVGPWMVELAEDTPLDPSKPPLRKAAARDGRWTADQLRATVYTLSVRNEAGSVLQQVPVDLSAGGTVTLPVTVHAIVVRGSVKAGDDPLSADLTFSNGTANQVRATSGEDGSFEAEFPATGTWQTRVRYPRTGSSRIDAPSVEIEPNTSTIEVRLPGGRVRGSVVTTAGDPEPAAVHLFRNRAPVAQQMTSDVGAFDLVGIGEGDYTIDAAGRDGMTPAPVPLHVDRDETRELKLTVEPFRLIRGSLLTPSGAPAVGAAVRVSTDGGATWLGARVDGRAAFEHRVPRSVAEVQLLVLSYAYPAALRDVPVTDEEIVIALQSSGGFLDLESAGGRAFIRSGFAGAPLNAFYLGDGGSMPFGRIYLEPGAYTVCPGVAIDGSCREVMVHAGSEIRVDLGRGAAR